MTNLRKQNALKALIHENDLAIQDLIALIHPLSSIDLQMELNLESLDPDCVSIKTILNHVLRSGYGYINVILKKNKIDTPIHIQTIFEFEDAQTYCEELIKLSVYTEEKLFLLYDDMIEEYNPEMKIKVSWGQYYDIEQLLEHAIVHVLRHRYQIEKFLEKLGN